jgi:hypothetical protein
MHSTEETFMKSTLTIMSLLLCLLAVRATAEDASATTKPAETNLSLFAKDAAWEFKKNKAEGSFELDKDGDLPIGVVNYDFSKIKGEKAIVVVASTKVTVAEGPNSIQIDARSSQALPITIRFIDASGQTLQSKGKLKGGGAWETVNVSFTKKFEAWGGAKDGKIHFPIQQIALVVAAPKDDPKTGKVEFANARTEAK